MKYATILADPPWKCNNQATTAAPEFKDCFRYKTMPTKDICALPIGVITEKNAHLYLWFIDAMMEDALMVCKAWGFTPKCNLIWVKVSKWGKPLLGCGNYFRHQHEICMFAVKGSMRTNTFDTPTVFFGEMVGHSRKPLYFYNLITISSPGPRLELFARQNAKGFDAWGDDPAIKSIKLEC